MRIRNIQVSLILAMTAAITLSAQAEDQLEPFFSHPFLLGAHRGGSDLWPENTLAAFKDAAKQYPGILLETDARLTADGKVILMHDGKVDRTTDGTGEIAELNLDELKALDAGYRFSPDGGSTFPYRGKGVQIPTLAEALTALPGSRFLVEFKGEPALADEGIRIIREAHATNRVLIASFKPETMARVREIAPELPTCYDFNDGAALLAALRGDGWDAYRPTDEVLSLDQGILAQFKITPEELHRIRDKGIKIQLHTINSRPKMEKILAVGVDSILTDRPDLLAEVLAKRQPTTDSKTARLHYPGGGGK